MKKLLILVAVAMIAAVSQAAAVGWSLMGAATYGSGNYDIFVIGQKGVTGTAQIAALVEAGTAVSSYAFYEGSVTSAGVATVPYTTSGKTITYSGSGTDTYQAFAVLWTSDGSKASYTSVASITMDNDATSKTFAFGNQSSNLANNQFTVNVPEPTSGLMLLLGVAGLALKRKRA